MIHLQIYKCLLYAKRTYFAATARYFPSNEPSLDFVATLDEKELHTQIISTTNYIYMICILTYSLLYLCRYSIIYAIQAVNSASRVCFIRTNVFLLRKH